MTMTTVIGDAGLPEIGKYHILAELATGGMGHVYLAASRGPGRFQKLLAMKELKARFCENPTFVEMFLEEARLAARLVHPNIVQTYEVGSDGGRHFMVMEYLDGRSLSRIVKRMGPRFPVGAHLRVIAECLLGLHFAHELRGFDGEALEIVHRDISPLNVFVTFNGEAKVIDFGISKAADTALETKTGILKGRVAYMAPEQALGSKVDRRTDIYAMGVMIWEAAAGRRLWAQMSEVDILKRLIREAAPPLRSVRPDVPEDLDRICARAMASRREDRYATAVDLLADLEAHLARRDDALTLRKVGALVGQVFADERRQMNAIIEDALTRVRGPTSGVVTVTQPSPIPPSGAYPQTPTHAFGPPSSQSSPATTTSLGPTDGLDVSRIPRFSRAAVLAMGAGMLLGVLIVATARLATGPSPRTAATGARAAVSNALADAGRTPAEAQVSKKAPPDNAPGVSPDLSPAPASAPALRAAPDPWPASRTPRPAPRVPSSNTPSSTSGPNCRPPYIIDPSGVKRWRVECL